MPSVSSLSNDVYRALAHETDVNSDLYQSAIALADAVMAASATGHVTTNNKPKPKAKAKGKRPGINPSPGKITAWRREANTHLASANGSIDVYWTEIFNNPVFRSKMSKVIAAAVWASRHSGTFTNETLRAATDVAAFKNRDKTGQPVHDAYVRAVTKAMYRLKITSRDYVVGTNKLQFSW